MSERGAISLERDEIVDEQGGSGIERSDLGPTLSGWSGGANTHVSGEAEILTAQLRSHALVCGEREGRERLTLINVV